jgi:hypothetical protein
LAGAGAGAIQFWVGDPPDPNYMSIAEPTIPAIPDVVPYPDATAAELAAWNALRSNLAQSAAFAMALLTAQERAEGAEAAGDDLWRTEQTAAAARYEAQLVALVRAQPALFADVQAAWRAAGRPSVSISADQIRDLQRNPMGGLGEGLRGLDVDDRIVAEFIRNLQSLDPDLIAGLGSYPDNLTHPAFVETFSQIADVLDGGFASLGTTWGECEAQGSSGLANCIPGVWTSLGDTWVAEWDNGATADLTISRNGSQVTIRRVDSSGASAGLQAEYSGHMVSPTRAEGTVTWCCDGYGTRDGIWVADISGS